jgi:hypothetical protein
VAKVFQTLDEDKEADQMATAAKKMMKLTFGSPAVRAIRFTVGKEETDEFAKRQAAFAKEGKPHCVKIERNLGERLMRMGVVDWAASP